MCPWEFPVFWVVFVEVNAIAPLLAFSRLLKSRVWAYFPRTWVSILGTRNVKKRKYLGRVCHLRDPFCVKNVDAEFSSRRNKSRTSLIVVSFQEPTKATGPTCALAPENLPGELLARFWMGPNDMLIYFEGNIDFRSDADLGYPIFRQTKQMMSTLD